MTTQPTIGELASALRAAHRLLGRLPAKVFASLPTAELDLVDRTVRRLAPLAETGQAGGGRGRRDRTGRDPLLERIREALAMDGPPAPAS